MQRTYSQEEKVVLGEKSIGTTVYDKRGNEIKVNDRVRVIFTGYSENNESLKHYRKQMTGVVKYLNNENKNWYYVVKESKTRFEARRLNNCETKRYEIIKGDVRK